MAQLTELAFGDMAVDDDEVFLVQFRGGADYGLGYNAVGRQQQQAARILV